MRDYETDTPGLGHSVAYHLAADEQDGRFSRATVTVYLYPAMALPEPLDGPDAAVWREAAEVADEFDQAVASGFYAEVEFRGHSWMEAGDSVRFLLMEVLVRPRDRDAADQHGAVCLTWLNGRFFKFRITSLDQEETRLHAIHFPAAVLTAVQVTSGTTLGPAGRA
jgi:hypothetical protein